MKNHRILPVILLFLLTGVTGCSWFGDDEEEEPKDPTDLVGFKQEVSLDKLWSTSIGDGAENRRTTLVPAIQGSRIFIASVDGNIAALNLTTGKKIWKRRLKNLYGEEAHLLDTGDKLDIILGGVGLSSELVIVSTSTGELVAVNQSDGSLAWRAKTTSEVTAPIIVGRDVIVAQSTDGKVAAYDAIDGDRKWIYSTSVPSLTLRGTASPLLFDKFVIAGFANGRVAMIGLEDGMVRFEKKTGVPKGDSDLDRLIDVDGTMIINGSTLYAVSYQGGLVAINLTNGRVLWKQDASSTAGLGFGFGAIYISHSDGRLESIDVDAGRSIWVLDALMYRELSSPVSVSSYVAVGDLDGYLHLVAQSDGRFVARRKVDGEPIRAPVVADGNRIYLMGNSGKLSAYEVR